MSENHEEAGYEPVLPFINVNSLGGEYRDVDYVAGVEIGIIQGQMYGDVSPTPEQPSPGALADWRWLLKGNADQLDLIAMNHGYRVEFGETFDNRVAVRLVKASDESL